MASTRPKCLLTICNPPNGQVIALVYWCKGAFRLGYLIKKFTDPGEFREEQRDDYRSWRGWFMGKMERLVLLALGWMIAKGGIMISINICRAEAVRREGIHVLLSNWMEYNPLCFPLLNCKEKLCDSGVIRTAEKSECDYPGSLRTKLQEKPRSVLKGILCPDSGMHWDARAETAGLALSLIFHQSPLPTVRFIHCVFAKTFSFPGNHPHHPPTGIYLFYIHK